MSGTNTTVKFVTGAGGCEQRECDGRAIAVGGFLDDGHCVRGSERNGRHGDREQPVWRSGADWRPLHPRDCGDSALEDTEVMQYEFRTLIG